jgi:hypothetical protein
MKSTTKTWLIVLGSVAGVFIVPAMLVLLHEYLNAIIFIIVFISCLALFSYQSYIILLPAIQRADLEEQEIKDRFHGDPEKMRYYRGFKKYFQGELNEEQLKRWFINHPRH